MDGREEEMRRVKGESEIFSLNYWNDGIAITEIEEIVCGTDI